MNYNKPFTCIRQKLIVPESLAGKRLDQVLALSFPDYSRSLLQKWLKSEKITVDGGIKKGKDKLNGNEEIIINVDIHPEKEWVANDIPLEIVYEDDEVIVINKPINLIVHPGAGNPDNTILNALIHHYPDIVNIPRAGIVHRLDKDTTGLMAVAKTLKAHTSLVDQLQKRIVTREYEAIICGHLTAGSTIDQPIGRNPHNRLKMAVTQLGKPAITHYNVIEKYYAHTRVRCKLETGRTHQIRVHMAHIHAPILGDQTYNPRLKIPKAASEELTLMLRGFKRQALHACRLEFTHPGTNKKVSFKAKVPEDMQELIKVLRLDAEM